MELPVLLKALGDPTRLSIFQQLLLRRHCVRSMSKKIGITESAVSQHLKVLREAGLVSGEQFGRHTHYLPRQEALDYLAGALEEMRRQSSALCRDSHPCQCVFQEKAGRR